MNNGFEAELRGFFAGIPEPEEDRSLTRRVTRRIALHRYSRWILAALLAVFGVALLAALTPWLIREGGHIVVGLLSASSVVAVLIARVGWILGIAAVIFVLVKCRS